MATFYSERLLLWPATVVEVFSDKGKIAASQVLNFSEFYSSKTVDQSLLFRSIWLYAGINFIVQNPFGYYFSEETFCGPFNSILNVCSQMPFDYHSGFINLGSRYGLISMILFLKVVYVFLKCRSSNLKFIAFFLIIRFFLDSVGVGLIALMLALIAFVVFESYNKEILRKICGNISIGKEL